MSPPKAPEQRIIYIVLTVLFSFFLFTAFGDRGFLHLWRLWQEKKRIDHENFLLQRENEILRDQARRLRRDDLYLEKVAREELGLARPGEIVYRFVSPETKRNQTGSIRKAPYEARRLVERKNRS
jgi:cell division protein FtsB